MMTSCHRTENKFRSHTFHRDFSFSSPTVLACTLDPDMFKLSFFFPPSQIYCTIINHLICIQFLLLHLCPMSSGFHCYGFVVCTMCFRTIACIMCLKCTLHLAAVFYFLSTESRKCEKSLQNDQDLSEIMCKGCLCKVTGQVKIYFFKMVS